MSTIDQATSTADEVLEAIADASEDALRAGGKAAEAVLDGTLAALAPVSPVAKRSPQFRWWYLLLAFTVVGIAVWLLMGRSDASDTGATPPDSAESASG